MSDDDYNETATGIAQMTCVVCGSDFKYRIQKMPRWHWCEECVMAQLSDADSPRKRMIQRHLRTFRVIDAQDARIAALRGALAVMIEKGDVCDDGCNVETCAIFSAKAALAADDLEAGKP